MRVDFQFISLDRRRRVRGSGRRVGVIVGRMWSVCLSFYISRHDLFTDESNLVGKIASRKMFTSTSRTYL